MSFDVKMSRHVQLKITVLTIEGDRVQLRGDVYTSGEVTRSEIFWAHVEDTFTETYTLTLEYQEPR